jgi:hypothetical protein
MLAKAKAPKVGLPTVPKTTLKTLPPTSLDPDPERRQRLMEKAEKKAEPLPLAVSTIPAQAPAKAEKKDGRFLVLGHGYKISHKPGSGYSVMMRIMAKEGHFEEVVDMLDGGFDPSDKEKALQLLSKLLVKRDVLEGVMKLDSDWRSHCMNRLSLLRARAEGGDKKAKKTLQNAARVRDGEWVGNIREIISTNKGSERCKNNNVKKFHDAGLIFSQHPKRPHATDDVYLMLYPARHKAMVEKALEQAFGKEEASR